MISCLQKQLNDQEARRNQETLKLQPLQDACRDWQQLCQVDFDDLETEAIRATMFGITRSLIEYFGELPREEAEEAAVEVLDEVNEEEVVENIVEVPAVDAVKE